MGKMTKIIVTGSAGFIGSHLSEALLERGYRVVGLDNFITGRRENLVAALASPAFQLVEVDVNDRERLWQVLEENADELQAVLHFASPASPPLYQRYPQETYLVNSWATHNLLFWLQQHRPQARFVYASSSEVYGEPQVHPQAEGYWGNVNPNGVRSCYDEGKRMGETICGVFTRGVSSSLAQNAGMDVRMVRIFNTYGPRMDVNDGRILPQFVKECLAGEKLTVYGDGSQTRSYCFVDDLVAGIIKLLEGEGLAGTTVNLGNSGEFSVLETAKIFNELTGKNADNLVFLPLPQDDPTRRRPDISLAKKLLDWEPQVEFRDGLARMIASYNIGRLGENPISLKKERDV
jgi:nucleoside-diphosphate-sugar epimerase